MCFNLNNHQITTAKNASRGMKKSSKKYEQIKQIELKCKREREKPTYLKHFKRPKVYKQQQQHQEHGKMNPFERGNR